MRIDEFIELPPEQRAGAVPFIEAADGKKRLVRYAMGPAVVTLVEDRKQYWQTLQYLAGIHVSGLTAEHQAELDQLEARYAEATQQREDSLDSLAHAMTQLATASSAPVGASTPVSLTLGPVGGPLAGTGAASAGTAVLEAPPGSSQPISVAPEDEYLCNDCKTCYQELPQFFTPVQRVIDGEVRTVATMAEVVAIGPPLMMHAVSTLTEGFGVHTVASLNSIMVDATGMCGACMVPVMIDGALVRKHACIDGPEIDAHIIDWEKFLPRFGQFKAQEASSRNHHEPRAWEHAT